MDEYLTLKKDGSREVVIERSRFITTAKRVESEEEAKSFVAEMKKKYGDATHNCYAYVTELGGYSRYSDDGEPSGTAGAPILSAINALALYNVAVVVTRYFGGIKLGTGGLSRAYGGCASSCLGELGVEKKVLAVLCEATLGYEEYKGFPRFALSNGLIDVGSEFSENVKVSFAIKKSAYKAFIDSFNDFVKGRIELKELGEEFVTETVV